MPPVSKMVAPFWARTVWECGEDAGALDGVDGAQRGGTADDRVDGVVDAENAAEDLGDDLADVGIDEIKGDVAGLGGGAGGGFRDCGG